MTASLRLAEAPDGISTMRLLVSRSIPSSTLRVLSWLAPAANIPGLPQGGAPPAIPSRRRNLISKRPVLDEIRRDHHQMDHGPSGLRRVCLTIVTSPGRLRGACWWSAGFFGI